MVIRSGFEVQLVYADTKIPLKEHEKDGKIFVEAEPDAEYFIAMRRLDMNGPPMILGYFCVDGKSLGYRPTDGEGRRSGMGKVEVKLYKGISQGMKFRADFSSGFEQAVGDAATAADSKKKFLLSKKGSKAETFQNAEAYEAYSQGRLIDSITLNYCSALGMIEAGVLPKADIWTHARMKHPANNGQPTVPVKKEKELLDPSNLIDRINLSEKK